MAELMEYAHLLEQADNCEDPYMRSVYTDIIEDLYSPRTAAMDFVSELFVHKNWLKLLEPIINGHLSMVPIDMEPQPIILAYIDLNLQTLAAARMLTPAGPVDLE
uniref:Uncharacterized protein n=1 Tax=Lactuca sativa TaxID=4236 RepID=A0A9R1WGM8_LACSA|nr:hypothetical protein LSAT_V11C200072680 [Lactuca sativa]